MRGSGQVFAPSRPALSGASSIFNEDATALALASDQTFAKKLANQLMYGTPTAKGGAFYGYSGMGYGGHPEKINPKVDWKQYNAPLWVVPPNQPTKKVWFVQEEAFLAEEKLAPEETLRTGEGPEAVQKLLEAVPLPTLTLTRQGRLRGNGTDGEAIVWRPSTGELWTFHRLTQFVSGPHQGEWKAGNVHYQSGVYSWSGILAAGTGNGPSASGLFCGGGEITLSDLVRVLRGGEIGHALSCAVIARSNEHAAPAWLNDHGPNTFQKLEDNTTPNPAYTTKGPEKAGDAEGSWKEGYADAVPEGTWCRFPTASKPSEFNITKPLEVAIYEAIRKHGLLVRDGSSCKLYMSDPTTLFTPYCDVSVNPFRGASWADSYVNEGTTEGQRAAWVDTSLPTLEEELTGANNVLKNMPWRELELLEPRSS